MKFQQFPDNANTLSSFACSLCGNTPLPPGPLPETLIDVFTYLVCCYTDDFDSSTVAEERQKLMKLLIESCDSLPEQGTYTAAVPKQLRVCVLADDDNAPPSTHCLSFSHTTIKDVCEKLRMATPKPGYHYMTGRCWVGLSNPSWRLELSNAGELNASNYQAGRGPHDCSIRILITDMNITSNVPQSVRNSLNRTCYWNELRQKVSSWFSFLD